MTALRAMASSPATVTIRLPRFMPPTTTAPAYGGRPISGTRARPWTSSPVELCSSSASSREGPARCSGWVCALTSVPVRARRRSGDPWRVMTTVASATPTTPPTATIASARAALRRRRPRRVMRARSVGGVVARVAPAQALPQRQLLPARLACPPLLVIEPRIRKEDGDHLLAEAVPEAEPPLARHARATVGVEERGARDAADHRLRGRGRAVVLADTEVEVPRPHVHREVAVEHRDGRFRGEADLVGGALDHRAREDLGPVPAEELAEQALDGVAADGDLVVLGHAAPGAGASSVRVVMPRMVARNFRGRQRSSKTTGRRTRSARGRTSGGNGTPRTLRAASRAAVSSTACEDERTSSTSLTWPVASSAISRCTVPLSPRRRAAAGYSSASCSRRRSAARYGPYAPAPPSPGIASASVPPPSAPPRAWEAARTAAAPPPVAPSPPAVPPLCGSDAIGVSLATTESAGPGAAGAVTTGAGLTAAGASATGGIAAGAGAGAGAAAGVLAAGATARAADGCRLGAGAAGR